MTEAKKITIIPNSVKDMQWPVVICRLVELVTGPS